jgi:hypothetical protein
VSLFGDGQTGDIVGLRLCHDLVAIPIILVPALIDLGFF